MDISKNQGGEDQGNLIIYQSGKHNYGSTTYDHPEDSLVFHNDWFVLRITEGGLVRTLDNFSNTMRYISGVHPNILNFFNMPKKQFSVSIIH